MDTKTIEAVMGKGADDIDAQVAAQNRLNRMLYLEEHSFEFSLKGAPQTAGTCDFAFLNDANLAYRHNLLVNTLERDGIEFEFLNARRGKTKPGSGITPKDAYALEELTRTELAHAVFDADERPSTPTVIRVHLTHDDMLAIYREAVSCESAKLERHIAESRAALLGRDQDVEI